MDALDTEYQKARERAGRKYCVSCAIEGLIEDGTPKASEMEVRWSLLGERPYREDILMKCTRKECHHTQLYGYGITKEKFGEKLDRRGKKKLDPYQDDISKVDEEHLRDLGYKF